MSILVEILGMNYIGIATNSGYLSVKQTDHKKLSELGNLKIKILFSPCDCFAFFPHCLNTTFLVFLR